MWLLLSFNNSVNVEMPLLLLLLLVLPLSNPVSSEQSENVKDDPEETMYKSEKLEDKFEELMQRMERMDISWKTEKADLEKKLETKNVEVENLQEQLKEVKVKMLATQRKNRQEVSSLKSEMTMQIAEMKAQQKNQNREVAHSLKSEMEMQCKAEVKKELDKVLPTAVEQGLRDLPFEMVCAYKDYWTAANSIINYNRITVEFNNSDRPGGLFVQIY